MHMGLGDSDFPPSLMVQSYHHAFLSSPRLGFEFTGRVIGGRAFWDGPGDRLSCGAKGRRGLDDDLRSAEDFLDNRAGRAVTREKNEDFVLSAVRLVDVP